MEDDKSEPAPAELSDGELQKRALGLVTSVYRRPHNALRAHAIDVLKKDAGDPAERGLRNLLTSARKKLPGLTGRRRLGLLLGATKQPHLAELLSYEGFPEIRDYLDAREGASRDDGSSPIAKIESAHRLYSVGVWAVQHVDMPEVGGELWERRDVWARRMLELVTTLRRNARSNLGRRILRRKLWPVLESEEKRARGHFQSLVDEALWRQQLEDMLFGKGPEGQFKGPFLDRKGGILEKELRVCKALFEDIRAELALCTSLATDLAPARRLDKAWDVLNLPPDQVRLVDSFVAGQDSESLDRFALGASSKQLQRGGFIFKRKWDHDRRRVDLDNAARLYGEAYEKAKRNGRLVEELRCAAEAAFQYDVLARQLGVSSPAADRSRGTADRIRLEALTRFDDCRSAPGESATTDEPPLPTALTRYPQIQYRSLFNLAQLYFGVSGREKEIQRLYEGTKDWEKYWRERLAKAGDNGLKLPAAADTYRREAKICLREAARKEFRIPLWLSSRKGREIAERAPALGVAPEDLDEFMPGGIHVVKSASAGRVGLALSGGGFRASFFHLGVLARLAEVHLLRHVEVLSCVSGGSIVGAHYYLELRDLLGNPVRWRKTRRREGDDTPVSEEDHALPEDYLTLVEYLIENFLKGVEANIRTRVLANPLASLRLLSPNYSRSDRAGDLFETHLFARVPDDRETAPSRRKKRLLSDMTIHPKDFEEPESFNPAVHNWNRENKIPVLILNATSLNTGHNWQFTAKWMGESPAVVDQEIDATRRLRRMYLDSEAPHPHGELRLGRAVAASACVPGIFDPAVLAGLYEERLGEEEWSSDRRIVVRLVDGGVFDNQGVAGLLEQECRVVLVSDASGQMDFRDDPSGSLLGVPLRSNAILMDRIRQAQYGDLVTRKRNGQIRGLVFLHLKKDLEGDSVDWTGCDDPKSRPSRSDGQATSYGILKSVQRRLAEIRTDLDSFCEQEAYALMCSGYRMLSESLLRRELGRGNSRQGSASGLDLFDDVERSSKEWEFLKVEKFMTPTPLEGAELEQKRLFDNILHVANRRLFKIFRLWTAPLRGWVRKRWGRLGDLAKTCAVAFAVVLALTPLWWLIPWSYRGVKSLLAGGLNLLASGTGGAHRVAVWLAEHLPFLHVGEVESIEVVAGIVVFGLLTAPILLLPRTLGNLRKGIVMLLLTVFGVLFGPLHLGLSDRAYKRKGRLQPKPARK